VNALDLSIPAAFVDPVGDAQAAFRLVLRCMAEPGTVLELSSMPAAVPGLGLAAAALALSLADFETPVWLGAGSQSAAPWLRFHCGTPIVTEPARARFAFARAGEPLPDLETFDLGSDEFPDRSATLIVELPDLRADRGLSLSGPGIADTSRLDAAGLESSFWVRRAALVPLFPRGLDLILTCGTRMAALPRTTRVEA
jgi:alpha-D-ribose 1-methylphosphonate 5-triphosphate synthase subunit PhnH